MQNDGTNFTTANSWLSSYFTSSAQISIAINFTDLSTDDAALTTTFSIAITGYLGYCRGNFRVNPLLNLAS